MAKKLSPAQKAWETRRKKYGRSKAEILRIGRKADRLLEQGKHAQSKKLADSLTTEEMQVYLYSAYGRKK